MAHPHSTEVAPPPWLLRGNATAIPYRRGILVFLRYTESNVGPYDELLWLAPFQRAPGGRAHRVPAIFVSSEASVRGGRANWGLPKELAAFHVSAVGAETERVDVTHEGQPLVSFVRRRPSAGLLLDAKGLPGWARRLVQLREGRYFETVPEGSAQCQVTRVSRLEVNRARLPGAHGSRLRLAASLSQLELCFPAATVTEAA